MPLPENIPINPGNWDHLNTFLAVSHNADGTLQAGAAAGASDGTAWELVWSTGINGGGKPMLARMHSAATSPTAAIYDDLYWLDTNSASAHRGLWRYRAGTWTQLDNGIGVTPNFITGFGATAFKDTLIVTTTQGNVQVASFTSAGAFSAYTKVYDGAAPAGGLPAAEDNFAGPVFNGKVYIGNFGHAGDTGPFLTSWDGSVMALVKNFTASFGVSPQAAIDNFAIADGLLYFTASGTSNGKQWFCCMDAAENVTVLWTTSGVANTPGIIYGQGGLTNWRGQIVAGFADNNGASESLRVWTGSAWSTPIASSNVFARILPVGDSLLVCRDSGPGPRFYTDTASLTTTTAAGWDSNNGTFMDAIVHNGYLWLTMWQNDVSLWRLRLGTDHIQLRDARKQNQVPGRQMVQAVDVTAALPTVAPSSGVAFQLSTVMPKFLTAPFTTTGAATIKAELGPTSGGTFYTLYTKAFGTGITNSVDVQVPQGWYVKLTVVNATLGTATYW